jgi:hypothetical protein
VPIYTPIVILLPIIPLRSLTPYLLPVILPLVVNHFLLVKSLEHHFYRYLLNVLAVIIIFPTTPPTLVPIYPLLLTLPIPSLASPPILLPTFLRKLVQALSLLLPIPRYAPPALLPIPILLLTLSLGGSPILYLTLLPILLLLL